MKQSKDMYALLLAAAVMVGGSIWFACSADDEFESNYEMETLAKGEMSLSAENPSDPVIPIYHYGIPIDAGGDTIHQGLRVGVIMPIYTYWTMGFTGIHNPTGPNSEVYAILGGNFDFNSIDSLSYEYGSYFHYLGKVYLQNISCMWNSDTELKYTIQYGIHWRKYNNWGGLVTEFDRGGYSSSFERTPNYHQNDSIQPDCSNE